MVAPAPGSDTTNATFLLELHTDFTYSNAVYTEGGNSRSLDIAFDGNGNIHFRDRFEATANFALRSGNKNYIVDTPHCRFQ